MFRSFSYCHVPSNLGNRQLEQGRINNIGSFFWKSVFFFITHIAAMCWDPSYGYLIDLMGTCSFSLSLLIISTASRVVLDFILVVKSHNCSRSIMLQFITIFLFLISA